MARSPKDRPGSGLREADATTKRLALVTLTALALHVGFLDAARRSSGSNLLTLRLEQPGVAALTWIDTSETAAPTPEPAPAQPPPVEPEPAKPTDRADATPSPTDRDTPRAPSAVLASPPDPATDTASTEAEALAAEATAAVDVSPAGPSAPGAATSDARAPAASPGSSGASEWAATEAADGVASLLPKGPGLDLAAELAIAGATPRAAPTTIDGSKVAADKAANEAVKSTLIGADKAVGIDLPATQVVVGAVSTATRALPVAHNTRASFEVKLDGSGKVTSVRVLKASGGDAATWSGAAKAAAASLSGKDLGLGGAKGVGATVTVDVKVRHVFPSGASKAADVRPVCANQLINDVAEAATSGKTKDAGDGEGVPLLTDENGRPCIPVGVTGVTDETNIGATKQIQVQTSSRVTIGGKKALPADLQKVDKSAFWVKSQTGAPRPVAPFRVRKWEKKRADKK